MFSIGTVPRRISTARRDAGLTQRELADRIGTSLWAIDELEHGRLDSGSYAAAIESATSKPSGWLLEPDPSITELPSRTERSAVSDELTKTETFDRNLVLGVFVIILTVRFFTTSIPLIPIGGNFIDVFLWPILLAVVALRPVDRTRSGLQTSRYFLPAVLFAGLCAVSVVVNVSRVAPAPALLFLYGFLGPLLFYYATYRLWPTGQALALSKTIVALGVLQFIAIGFVDLPKFIESGNPDDVAGTFGGNAYQLVFFLLVFAALLAGIATFERGRPAALLALPLFVLTFVVIFLAQYRALLLFTALTVLLVGFMLSLARGRGFAIGAVIVIASIGALGYVSAKYPKFKFAPTIEAVRENPTLFITARLDPGRDVLSLYADNPLFIVSGTGPGTYSSRAWRTFAEVGKASAAEGAAQPYATALTGGQAYHTDVSDRYVLPRWQSAPVVLGSHAVTQPFSSYIALLAEVGVLGFLLMVVLYVRGLFGAGRIAHKTMRSTAGDDPLPALALATTVAFFLLLQMGFLENWWEVARATVPTWMMLAICTKEFVARGR